MATIRTRKDFGKKILRNLGHPVIKINVSQKQIDDAIDDAISYFVLQHRDFIKEVFYQHTIEQEDIDHGLIVVPDRITTISELCENNSYTGIAGSDTGGFGTYAYHNAYDHNIANQISGGSGAWDAVSREIFDIFNETVIKQYEDTQRFIFTLSEHTIKLLDILVLNRVICIHAWEALITEDDLTNSLFNNTLFQKMAELELQKRWGGILTKFAGVRLPGGLDLDGAALKAEAIEGIEKLKEDILEENNTATLRMYIG